MAAKIKPALTRGSLAAETKARRRVNVTSQSGIISDTASTVSASQHSAFGMTRENLKLENTYKMEPDQGKGFATKRVSDAVSSVLESYLSDYTYEAKTCARLTCDLSNMVKARVKEMGFDRYKLVCQVVIGEKQNQGINIVSRFLWDKKNDSYATGTYSNGQIYAVANVYGLFFE